MKELNLNGEVAKSTERNAPLHRPEVDKSKDKLQKDEEVGEAGAEEVMWLFREEEWKSWRIA